MKHRICSAVVDDSDGRSRWVQAWYRDNPTLRVIARFFGADPAAERRAIDWAQARLAEWAKEEAG